MNKPLQTTGLCALALLLTGGISLQADPQSRPGEEPGIPRQPLPRTPDTGIVPDDPNQRVVPFALDLLSAGSGTIQLAQSASIVSPPEYDPVEGVLMRYGAGWNSVVRDMVVALTANPNKDERAVVVVTTQSQKNSATTYFANAGADMTKVDFVIEPSDSIWMRDYGPHFIWQEGARVIVDSHYYSTRPQDNFLPTRLATNFYDTPSLAMGLYYSGGNFQAGPNRSGYITSLINQDNGDLDLARIQELYRDFQGIDTLHLFPRLPSSVDGTGHIDMWFYLVDANTVIISEFVAGSNATAINVTNNAVTYMQGLGFTVHRVPAWNVGSTHYTYANAFRVNDRLFIPSYGQGNASYLGQDAAAAASWQAAAGQNVEIIPINCYGIIPASGAIHCIVKQVPRYTASVPSLSVLQPRAGDVLVRGNSQEIVWAASDDKAVAGVQLHYSTDGGQSFPHLVKRRMDDTGTFDWDIPLTQTLQGVFRIRVGDFEGNLSAGYSEREFRIIDRPQHVYDFSTGAGVDKFAWGSNSTNWSELEQSRYPASVSTSIEVLVPGAWNALARSDADGEDGDTNRYRSPKPTGGRESSHIYEFNVAEAPNSIIDLAVQWEGYGDQCLQTELYIWDNVAGNWGDGAGASGANNYMDAHAGNWDKKLGGHIARQPGRYIDAQGKVTLLIYAERNNQSTFHDYVSLTVTH